MHGKDITWRENTEQERNIENSMRGHVDSESDCISCSQ